METTYKTSELEVASFLKTRGHKLVGAKPQGRIVEFSFDGVLRGVSYADDPTQFNTPESNCVRC